MIWKGASSVVFRPRSSFNWFFEYFLRDVVDRVYIDLRVF